jgi:D-3-phosphoglycerate dehydrogenase
MVMFKILVLCELGEDGINRLNSATGIRYKVEPDLSDSALIAIVPDYDALIVHSSVPVSTQTLKAGEKLKVIACAGIDIDNIDIETASERGILVMNTPLANSIAIAEHTMASLLAVCRHTAPAHASLLSGKWQQSEYVGIQLSGKTLGLIGFGRTAQEVAKRASAFDMKIIAYDPYVIHDNQGRGNVKLVELETLLAQSDIISLHIGLSAETENIFNEQTLSECRDGVIIVNPSQAKLVDDFALARALDSGKVRAVAIDNYQSEPPAPEHPLIGHANVLHTPGLGANTEEARRDVAQQVVEQTIDALHGRNFRNSVNMPFEVGSEFKKIEPFIILAAKIGALHFHMADGPINCINLELKGELVSDLAKPIATGLLKGYLELILPDAVNYVNAPTLANEAGITISQRKGLSAIDYTNLISVKAIWDGGDRTISGTLFSGEHPRIVQVSDYYLDVDPSGIMLVMVNDDTPGVIGQVGTILAEDKVNIAEWRLGRSLVDKKALAFIQLDSEPSSDAINQLEKISAIKKLKVIHL